jgi:hypothetical protein
MRPPRSAVLLAETRAVAVALAEEVERDVHSRTVDVLLKQLRALAAATVAAARQELAVSRLEPKQKPKRRRLCHPAAVTSASQKPPAARRGHRGGPHPNICSYRTYVRYSTAMRRV